MTRSHPDLPAVGPRPKKGAGIVVILVLMSLANLFTLLIGVVAVVDEIDHGRDLSDEDLQLALLVTVVSLVAVAGLVGAWMTRKWGPRLYAVTAALGLVVGLVTSTFTPVSLVGIALAVALWITAENNW